MRSEPLPSSLMLFAAVVLLSLPAGILNGIFGTGSGIVFMLISRILSRAEYTGSSVPRGRQQAAKDMYSFSMTCVIFVSLFSLFFYSDTSGGISDVIKLALPAVPGGIIGGLIKEKIRVSWLNMIFALITIYSGISMIVKSGVFS